MSVLLVVVFLLVIYKLYRFTIGYPPNFPPGIPRLPIWGSYWFLLWGDYKFPYKTLSYYVKKYKSKIISCYFGDFQAVVAADYESIKELLSRQEFDGRVNEAHIAKARAFGKKLGIFFNDGPDWQDQRRFALRHMRDFGFGRRMDELEKDFAEEITVLVDTLRHGPINAQEKTVIGEGKALFPDILYPTCVNTIWSVVAGERLGRQSHDKLRNVCRSAMTFQRSGDTSGGAILQTPWLRHFAHSFGFRGILAGTQGMINFIKEFLEEHKSTYIENAERGFLDKYIKKLRETEELSSFSEEQLLITVVDFIFPPLSATPSALTYFVKFMMRHPHVMKTVQKELDTVVGRGRLPTLDDRVNLPYTEATIREVLRAETVTPLALAHRAMVDTTFCGYNIPKDTVMMTNLAAMNNDPDLWGDPENFRPDRFLTPDGRLGKDYSLPFGAGRRLCAGETFARNTIFLICAALAQNFDFSRIDGQPSEPWDNIPGIIVTPKEVWIKVTARN